MRRVTDAAIAVVGLLVATTPATWAEPSSTASSAAAAATAAGTPVCMITDPRVTEVSGLVATTTGYIVINDSNSIPSREKIFFLDRRCRVTNAVAYPSSARDPEDLAVDKHGTVWVADIGDNSAFSGGSGKRRTTIALWSLSPGAKLPVIHRLTYPDARPRDAETLLIGGDGTIVIVTKEPAGEVYIPDGPLRDDNTKGVALSHVGTFSPAATGTSNPLGFIGAALVTGGAVSPDGTRAVVRTLSDAYEVDVTNGDVARAIATGPYRITPLPDEPQGEAISYTPDGANYLTGSDEPGPSKILRYRPKATAPATASNTPEAATAGTRSRLPTRSRYDLIALAVAGSLGVLLAIAGVVGIRRSRTRTML